MGMNIVKKLHSPFRYRYRIRVDRYKDEILSFFYITVGRNVYRLLFNNLPLPTHCKKCNACLIGLL